VEDREEGREVGGEAHVDVIDAIGLGQLGLLLDLLLEVLLAVERLELSFLGRDLFGREGHRRLIGIDR
jgi:hypothetical protein